MKKSWEPNEIGFSQGFSQKVVSRSCSVFNCARQQQLLSSADNQSENSLDQDQKHQA